MTLIFVVIPEQPSDENIKPVLDSLPAAPKYPVLRSGLTRNGRYYPPEVIASACQAAQTKVDQRTLFVYQPHHDRPGDLRDVVGIVEHMELDYEGTVQVEIKFLNPLMNMLRPVISFSAEGAGHVDGNIVRELNVTGIAVEWTPERS